MKTHPFIYLASQSPRRRQLLDQLGRRLAGTRLGLDGLQLQPHLGREAALEFLIGGFGPGGGLLADGGDDQAHGART